MQVTEVYAGLPPNHSSIVDDFIAALTHWDISHAIALRAGRYRYDFARRGRAISTPDALVAAVAWHHKAIIITDNVKDFPMADVQLWPLR